MNARELISATLRGEAHERIPLVSRDDLVPRGDIELFLRNRGMGLVLSRPITWCEYQRVEMDSSSSQDIDTIVYRTPRGSLSERRLRIASQLPHNVSNVLEGPIKGTSDYGAARFLAESAVFHTDSSSYSDVAFEIGDDGLVICQGPRPSYEISLDMYGVCPGAIKARSRFVAWAAEQERDQKGFRALVTALEAQEDRQLEAVQKSPVSWVSSGRIGGMVGPRRWRESFLPFYRRIVPQLHAMGKLVSLRVAGSNLRSFGRLVGDAGVDILEGFTPPPGGDLSLVDARDMWGRNTVIWANIPDAVIWWPVDDIRTYIRDLVASDPHPEALMIGFTETGLLGIMDDDSDIMYRNAMHAIADALDDAGHFW